MIRFIVLSICSILFIVSCKDDSPGAPDEEEIVTVPSTPSGPSSGNLNESLSYSTSGASSNLGHELEYQFHWGALEYSDWSSSTAASKSWNTSGLKVISVRARCSEHTSEVSSWSGTKGVTINPEMVHRVSNPSTPTGPDSGGTNESLSYNTSGASCNQRHNVLYRFYWGDGTYSNWSSSNFASHSWSDTGTTLIRTQARCSHSSNVLSGWSNNKTVSITPNVHRVNYPNQPSGPDIGFVGEIYTFTASGSNCSNGHSIQYRFAWGTAEMSPWSNSNTAFHSWDSPGSYYISAQARCATDTTIVSDWSLSILVIHIEESYCQIFVDSPYQGDVWEIGETKTIQWESSSACGSNVKIDLYESSNFVCPIISSTDSNGTYDWIVTDCDNGELNNYRIKITSLSTDSSGLSWYFSIVNNNETVELSAIKDAYVSDSHPNTNYGYSNWLVVGVNGNNEYWSYIQFDLSAIPIGATIELAELVLQRFLKVGSFDMVVKANAQFWSEGSITWNNTPIPHTFPFSVINPTLGGQSYERFPVEVDVTEIVQLWISGERSNYGFWFWFTPSTLPNGNEVDFGSRNHSESVYRPKLRVTYSE